MASRRRRAQRLILVHGRSFKPKADVLERLWLAALSHAIERDHGKRALARFERLEKQLAYFGDLSNQFLRANAERYSEKKDVADRENTLQALRQLRRGDFRRGVYEGLAGKTSLKEWLADIGEYPLGLMGLSDRLITAVAPDLEHYWDQDTDYGSGVRWRLTEPLGAALDAGEDVMLISHSLGTMIAFDVLWKFSHYGEWQALRHRRLSHWITMGSPLGNLTVKRNLKGHDAGQRRYPTNIEHWTNIAAEDDYISHDATLADDYRPMLQAKLIERIEDVKIYNPAVRHGVSNPHSSAGYLVNPRLAERIVAWMK
jgi:hypothetical protein